MAALFLLLVLAAPILLTVVVAAVAASVMRPHAEAIVRQRLARVLLVAELALAVVALAVLWMAPEKPNPNAAGTCPDLDGGGYDVVVGRSYFLIPFVGGLAAAAAYTESRPNRDSAIGYGLIGVAASYVVGVSYFLAGLCGFQ